MSYVELKHLLADLALEATRNPKGATWAPILAAYGTLATPQRLAVQWTDLQVLANELGAQFQWTAAPAGLARLHQVGLLEQADGLVRLRPAFETHLGYLRQHTTRLLGLLWRLTTAPPTRSAPDELIRGAALFNAGLFFECHEYLEGAWKATRGPEKDFYHGLIQVAAAFYHYEKRNRHGARTLLAKGLRRLEPYPQEYVGIDLGALRKTLAPWMSAFEAERGDGTSASAYPRVEFTA